MAIRVSGLASGLDTDSIVQELVSAYSKKKDKHVKAHACDFHRQGVSPRCYHQHW